LICHSICSCVVLGTEFCTLLCFLPCMQFHLNYMYLESLWVCTFLFHYIPSLAMIKG
jgi:hypothetical protein